MLALLLLPTAGGDGHAQEETRKSAQGGSPVTTRASTEISGYSDTDSVHVLSPTVSGSVADPVEGWSVSGRYLVDAVSAASVDIVSTASKHWFEVRHVGSLAAEAKAGAVGIGAAGSVSREPDYLSLSGGGTMSIELMDKNLTPFLTVSYGHDDVGRTGLPHEFWHTLQKVSAQVGATFVVDRATIASVSADGIFERGYLAKPYRYVPVFAPGVGATVPAGASVDFVNQKLNQPGPVMGERSIETLPDARDRYAVSGRLAHRFDGSTIRLDERLYRDSWGAMATTSDGRYMVDLGERWLLAPHVRFHVQSGISFWQRAYEMPPPNATPVYRTGDRELGPLYTATGGGSLRARLNSDGRSTWFLTFQVEGMFTRFLDALYVTQRRALFSNLMLEATFE